MSGAARCASFAVLAAALGCGCDDVQQHVYSGFPFDPVNACVSGTSNPIDVVPGPATGNTCAPVCLVASSGAVYVSPVCGPYPSGATVEAADASSGASDPCPAALAAYDAPDGGGSCGNGAVAGDAGEAGAGEAGAGEAGTGDAGDAGPRDGGND